MDTPTYVGIYWGPRREPVHACARRLDSCLTALIRTDPLLGTWYRRSRKATSNARPLTLAHDGLVEMLLAGRNKDDFDGEVIDDLGFRVSMWNRRPAAVALTCTIGSSSQVRGIGNSLVLSLPPLHDAPSLYELDKALAIMSSMIEALDPDWATWASHDVREAQGADLSGPIVGWLTYLQSDQPSTRFPMPTEDVVPIQDGYVIITERSLESVTIERVVATRNALRETDAI